MKAIVSVSVALFTNLGLASAEFKVTPIYNDVGRAIATATEDPYAAHVEIPMGKGTSIRMEFPRAKTPVIESSSGEHSSYTSYNNNSSAGARAKPSLLDRFRSIAKRPAWKEVDQLVKTLTSKKSPVGQRLRATNGSIGLSSRSDYVSDKRDGHWQIERLLLDARGLRLERGGGSEKRSNRVRLGGLPWPGRVKVNLADFLLDKGSITYHVNRWMLDRASGTTTQ